MKKYLIVVLLMSVLCPAIRGGTGDLIQAQTAILKPLPDDQMRGLQSLFGIANDAARACGKSDGKDAAIAAADAVLAPQKARILELTKSDHVGVVSMSLMLMNWMKPSGEVVESIVVLMAHTNAEISRVACESLAFVEYQKYPQARDAVIGVLQKQDTKLFLAGTRVARVWRMEEAIDLLAHAVTNNNRHILRAAADSLTLMGAQAKRALPALRAAAAEKTVAEDKRPIEAAIQAIEKILVP